MNSATASLPRPDCHHLYNRTAHDGRVRVSPTAANCSAREINPTAIGSLVNSPQPPHQSLLRVPRQLLSLPSLLSVKPHKQIPATSAMAFSAIRMVGAAQKIVARLLFAGDADNRPPLRREVVISAPSTPVSAARAANFSIPIRSTGLK